MADIDEVLERLVTDAAFRDRLGSDPAAALAAYDLSTDDLQLLASSLDDSEGQQHGVEQRTSKSAVVGLLASLTGGGGGGASEALKGGKGGSDPAQFFAYAPPGGGNDPSQAAVDFFAPADVTGNGPTDISGNAPADVLGNTSPAISLEKQPPAPLGGAADVWKTAPGDVKGHGAAIGDIKGLKIAPGVDTITGNLAPASPTDVNGDLNAIHFKYGEARTGATDAPPDEIQKVSPARRDSLAIKMNDASASSGAADGNLAPEAGAAPRKLDMPSLKAGGTSVNGDGSPAELIGLLQPPTGDGAKGIDIGQMKAGDTNADDFLTVEDA
ncbi:MAG: hypothetical protein JWP11_1205 [Frankiales bacterium]|nr:hypothetical protein [Frankiales bacterium]